LSPATIRRMLAWGLSRVQRSSASNHWDGVHGRVADEMSIIVYLSGLASKSAPHLA
jgi:hypothetical protein